LLIEANRTCNLWGSNLLEEGIELFLEYLGLVLEIALQIGGSMTETFLANANDEFEFLFGTHVLTELQ